MQGKYCVALSYNNLTVLHVVVLILLTVLNYVVLIQAEFHRVPQPVQGEQCSDKAHHHIRRNPSR